MDCRYKFTRIHKLHHKFLNVHPQYLLFPYLRPVRFSANMVRLTGAPHCYFTSIILPVSTRPALSRRYTYIPPARSEASNRT